MAPLKGEGACGGHNEFIAERGTLSHSQLIMHVHGPKPPGQGNYGITRVELCGA